MVQADRDEKRIARYCTPQWHLVGCFLTRVHQGIGLPGSRRQHRYQARPLVILGKDAQMMRLVMGWISWVNPV